MGGLVSSDPPSPPMKRSGERTTRTSKRARSEALDVAPPSPPPVSRVQEPTEASAEASTAIFKQYQELAKSGTEREGFRVELGSNLYQWTIRLFDFPPEAQIAEDLALYASARPERGAEVVLEAVFPPSFPHAPPFVRILYPRFHQYTGHITIGGSICVRELTLSGWSSAFKLTQFIIMIRNLLMDGGALVDMTDPALDYSLGEARAAFLRVAAQHGWKTT